MRYSVVKSENKGVGYVIMQHQHEEYERGAVNLPSIVVCECDTRDMAELVLQALEVFSKKWQEKTKEVDNCPYCGSSVYLMDTNTGMKYFCKAREKGCNWSSYE